MSLNRAQSPPSQKIENLHIPEPEKVVLNEHLAIYSFKHDSGDAVKLDIVFSDGQLSEEQRLINTACIDLLFSGSDNESSLSIMEKLDSLGAYISTSSDLNYSVLSIYCMVKYLDDVISIVKNAVETVSFPEK